MKVLMVCSGGMSSSIIVKAIKQEAEKQGFDLGINTVGTGEFENALKSDNYDMALVAPQVKHLFSTSLIDDVIIANAFASEEELKIMSSIDKSLLDLNVKLATAGNQPYLYSILCYLFSKI